MKAMGCCPSVSSDCLIPFCVQIKTREDTSLKSCVQAPKLSEGRDSIPPMHDLPMGGEHKSSFLTPILSTVRCCSHIKGLRVAQHLTQSSSDPLSHGPPGEFMPGKHWAAKGIEMSPEQREIMKTGKLCCRQIGTIFISLCEVSLLG